MNQLLVKLMNQTYELVGVILPGMVASIFLLLLWAALGPIAPFFTHGAIPAFTRATFRASVDSMISLSEMGAVVVWLLIWYFLGHFLLWISRGGIADDGASKSWVRRVYLSLTFRIPKLSTNYNPKLASLYEGVRKKFASEGVVLEWRQFYPVVHSYLSQRLTTSLVDTYQHKYTLHRSITSACAALFWLSLLAIVAAFVAWTMDGPQPNWLLLMLLFVSAGILVWLFSASYMLHWEMFGNSIVTEAYSLLYGPKDDSTTK
jgi:hypothetical protein